MKINIFFLILFVCACQKTEIVVDQALSEAIISYSFIKKYSNDTTLINTIFYTYLDSVQIQRESFETILKKMNSDIFFRRKIMTNIALLLDSTAVINTQYQIYKKIQALRNDSLSF